MTRALLILTGITIGITTTITTQHTWRRILATLLNGNSDDAPACKRPTLAPVGSTHMTYECGDCGRTFESEIALMFCCLPRNNDDGRDDTRGYN